MKDFADILVASFLVLCVILMALFLAVVFWGCIGAIVAYAWNNWAAPSYGWQPEQIIWWQTGAGLWAVSVVLKAVLPSRG